MNVDTIVAIATPPGRGGVGIIRASGPLSYFIATSINRNKELEPRKAYFSPIFTHKNTLIDTALLLYFKAPHSFTGEDVIEIQAHGSPIVLDLIVKECIHLGARIALPGEFSERAFLNDKIDLTQAEAIADLIQASSVTAARMALKSLQGEFSNKINQLNAELIHLRMYVEAAIDFPEEEIDFLSDGKVTGMLATIINNLETIHSAAHQGVILSEGLSLVIAGRPNAGKSTLINRLAGKDVAIVTEIAGTTRDVMREHILLDDIPLHIIDTAGLHESTDRVEQEGIKRAWQELLKADCVLLVVDAVAHQEYEVLLNELKAHLSAEVPIIIVYNKIDLLHQSALSTEQEVYISAQTGEGIEILKEKIKKTVGYQPTEGQFLARSRHIDALNRAKKQLLQGQNQLLEHKAGELLAEDLRLTHQYLCEITGEYTSDDLLGAIFSSFCIGK